jgi:OOP family OmpA-OmpF porin
MTRQACLAPLALLAASLSFTGPAAAQGYLGLGGGQSNIRLDCTGTTSCDRTDTAFKLFAGYQFTANWGVEGTYFDQGKATVTATDLELGEVAGAFKGYGFGLYAVGVLPFDKASIFAKLGAVSTRVKLEASSSIFGTAGASERHTRPAWGLGAGYEFSDAWSARLEYERVRVKFMDEKVKASLVTVSAVYRF